MAFRIDNDVEFLGQISGGGSGNLIIGQAASVNRRTPADVMNPTDTMIIKIEESGQHETSLCTLISSTEMVRTRVLDRWDRTGALVTPINLLNLTPVPFSQGTVYCAGTIPQPLNITLQPDGTFSYTDAIRASVFYQDIAAIQDPLSNISDGQVVFAVDGLASGDQLGGLFLYDAGGDNGTIDDIDIFAPGTVGNPRAGILIRQRIDAHAAFFRTDLSIYTPNTVARQKLHALGFGVSGADTAYMAQLVQRGSDGAGAYTDYDVIARDRQSAEVAFLRARSYGNANDTLFALKPMALPPVANKGTLVSGQFARSTADERIWYNDANRGLGQILLSDGGLRGTVDTVAALRLLTPDGYQDDELVLLNGYLTRGDGVQFLVKWDSASTAADNGYSVFKPTSHTDSSPWVEAGRFLIVAPLKSQKFTDNDQTVDAYTGKLWQTADTPPAGGVTNIQIIPGSYIFIEPNTLPCVFKHNANGNSGRLLLPNNTDLSLSSGDATLIAYEENGRVRIVGGGAGFVPVVSTQAAMLAVGDAINTTGKYKNKLVDDENGRTYKSTGALAADPWWPLDSQSSIEQLLPV